MSFENLSPEQQQQRNKEQREKYRRELMRAVANKTPVQIAAEGVENYFNNIIGTRESVSEGLLGHSLEQTFRLAATAIERDYRAEHGPFEDDNEPYWFDAEASYLVGVQVGLRLREAR